LDTDSPRSTLTSLNTAAAVIFRQISLSDWVQAASVLETQTLDPLAWYPNQRRAQPVDDELMLPDIFTTLDRSLCAGSTSRVLTALPWSIQRCCQFRERIRTWVISQLVSAKITLSQRVERINRLLEIITLCSEQTASLIIAPDAAVIDTQGGQHRVPSLVERAIASALISPESRLFSRAWVEVALRRGVGVEYLWSLFTNELPMQPSAPRSSGSKNASRSRAIQLVPCIGWALESMLQIYYSLPDTLLEDANTFSLERGNHIHRMVDLLRQYQAQSESATSNPSTACAFLLTPDALTQQTNWRTLQELTQKEVMHAPKLNLAGNTRLQKTTRVFQRLISEQQEKARRDSKERERLERDLRERDVTVHRRQESDSKSVQGGISMSHTMDEPDTSHAQNAPPVSQRGSSLNANAGRPLRKASTRPSAVINLVNAQAHIEHGYTKRPYVFRVVTEEGGQHLLQAADHQVMEQWIESIETVSRDTAIKRLSTLPANAEGAMYMRKRCGNASVSTMLIRSSCFAALAFGVDLELLMPGDQLPIAVEKCIVEIELRGIEEVGIYRVPGMQSAIDRLRNEFNRDAHAVDLSSEEWGDINAVAGVLKQFFRELPEPLLTNQLYGEFISAIQMEEYNDRMFALKDLLAMLPRRNYITFRRLIEHLERVTDFEEVNHMYATNLAIVFGPSLIRAPAGPGSMGANINNLGYHQNIIKNYILQYHWFFDLDSQE
ncbi:hypothetical protein THASP1DRAFT_9311, partial [Thamnocephalis sphaerospora]